MSCVNKKLLNENKKNIFIQYIFMYIESLNSWNTEFSKKKKKRINETN